jgi:hypothetical protein
MLAPRACPQSSNKNMKLSHRTVIQNYNNKLQQILKMEEYITHSMQQHNKVLRKIKQRDRYNNIQQTGTP